MVGNFMGDAVKGSKFEWFPPSVAQGIVFHRLIDEYTDTHAEVREAKRVLRPSQGKYSGVVLDVLFDHFLAKRWDDYHQESLPAFTQSCHAVIESQRDLLPDRAERFFRYMIAHDLLLSYSKPEGIQSVLRGMDSRTAYESQMERAVEAMEENFERLDGHFRSFFPDLIKTTTVWKQQR